MNVKNVAAYMSIAGRVTTLMLIFGPCMWSIMGDRRAGKL